MLAPRELPQKIPATGQKLGCKSPKVVANSQCQSPGCVCVCVCLCEEQGWLWQKLVAALTQNYQITKSISLDPGISNTAKNFYPKISDGCTLFRVSKRLKR